MEAALLIANIIMCGGVLYKVAKIEVDLDYLKKNVEELQDFILPERNPKI